ncbi:MAG: carboxypeptidase-like regulatory domain-containing protein [Flavobacteriales bacterium]|nr:carboxypeptidase-like regulatory domain-containing protein [Flavobacteriales bacterium]
MKKTILLYIFFLISLVGASQTCTFSGTVQNKKGEPIPYSSIYIPKLATGKMANMDGKYKISLPCGTYKIKVQCLGYETKFLEVNASSTNSKKTIVLSSKSFNIKEFSVNASDEDPAYNVMRKAIVMAKYYKKQIAEYDAKIYVRVFFLADKVPKLAKLFAEEKDLKQLKAGDLTETIMQYSYKRPNIVKEKIISIRSASGDTTKGKSPFINFSFYDLGGTQIVSPLSKSAFAVYKFELMSTYLEGENTVNKIKIIPKRKGTDLMNGYIYINEGSWNINSVDVKFKQQFTEIEYKQIYSEISDNAWMPINQELKVKAKAMGFKGHFKYIVSMSDIELKTDPKVDKKIKSLVSAPITEEFKEEELTPNTSKKAVKTTQRIKTLMDQEKLTRGETMKLVRLVNKQATEEKKKLPKDSVLEVTYHHKTEYADSAFVQNDSVWNAVRDVPLSQEENIIYNTRDSLTRIESGDTVVNKDRSLFGDLLFFNGTIKSNNKNSKLKIPGLFSKLSLNFNTVDGFVLKKTLFSYKIKYKKGNYWKIEPTAFYAFSRKSIMGKFDFKSQYNMKKRARFYFSGGRITSDFNSNKPMPNFFNSIATLFFSENYKKLYQKDFALIGNSFDITNGLNLNVSAEYADRTQLFNTSDFTVIKYNDKEYTLNTPSITDSSTSSFIFNSHKALNVSAILSYTPKQHFRYRDGNKQMLRSKYPTFYLIYKQGVKNAIESQSDYTRLEAAVHQVKSINLIDKVGWYVGGGKFLNNNTLYFADYKSFNTQPFYFIGNSSITSFKLLDFYNYNANNYFFEAHFTIEDNFLLFKNLPLLNSSFLSEGLYANYLYTPQQKHYYEFGYGLKNVFLLFDVEAFVSFKNKNYNSFGVKLSFNFIKNNDFN